MRTQLARAVALCLALVALAGRAPAQELLLGEASTPRRTLRHFIASCHAGRYDEAAADLSLPPDRLPDGPRLARRLELVLAQTLRIDWDAISDLPEGDPTDGVGRDVIGALPLGEDPPVPFVLGRSGGQWRIVSPTPRRLDELHAQHGGAWLAEELPPALYRHRLLGVEAWQWLGLLLAVPGALLVGLVSSRLVLRGGAWLARRTKATWDDRLAQALRGPTRYLVALLVFPQAALPLRLSLDARAGIDGVRNALLVVAVTWLCLRLVSFVAETLQETLCRGVHDFGHARGVKTQVAILRRIASVILVAVAAALVLTQFEAVRSVGVSLLASAGIAGIVIGLAAQKSIGTLLAGIQLSITQPIRIGDTVIVEGEWGWIEEITLTYVVVKVWDLRRLVVPITRFLDQSFENWTKVSPEIMGTVNVFADYAAPADAVREELQRICAGTPLWDGKVCGLQVTDVTPQTVTLRALVSSADASKNWDLRCLIRERLVRYLQELEGGRYLPCARVSQARHLAGTLQVDAALDAAVDADVSAATTALQAAALAAAVGVGRADKPRPAGAS